ncbi:hypothetical protein KSS87_018870 [Heliosperma pusillum]|nr:hypothetical protein KSS87_018870 [Heliosperma pusillum]
MADFGDRCNATAYLPCLDDPGRRSALCLKFMLVTIHALYFTVLFLVNPHNLFDAATNHPCYVVDAMRATTETESLLRASSVNSNQPATSKNGGPVISVDGNPLGKTLLGNYTSSWIKMVMEMYPTGSSMRQWTCTSCNVLQPPRAKHCHDCDKCVLQFDHHCVWLGTCIGQGNHCRFWWYIFAETALCLWTAILYISYLKANFSKSWPLDAVMIVLLLSLSISLVFLVLLLIFHSYLVLTNQTTYELVRRRRIPYMRGVPERVYPFSKGICRNIYNFCWAPNSIYNLERLPSAEELEVKSRPLSLSDAHEVLASIWTAWLRAVEIHALHSRAFVHTFPVQLV